MSFALSPRAGGFDHDAAVQAIAMARADARHVEASIQLERWIASCKRQGSSAFAEGSSSTSSAGGGGYMRLGKSRARMGDDGADDATVQQLLSLVPKVRKAVEKEGVAGEQVTYLTFANKHNAAGKVQTRLLVLSDQAVYNMSIDGKKSKRRIPLSHIGHVTASEPMAQFVLHVPSEYDYHYASPTRGHSLLDDDGSEVGSPIASVIDALQRSYARQAHAGGQSALPVRTFNDAGPLSNVVKKKRTPDDAQAAQAALSQYGSSHAPTIHEHGDYDDDDDD